MRQEESITAGSVVHNDGWVGYSGLADKGYVHEVTVLKGHQKSASEILPRVHRVISLLKRWLMGTHQGAVSRGGLFFRLVHKLSQSNPRPTKRSCGRRADRPNYSAAW